MASTRNILVNLAAPGDTGESGDFATMGAVLGLKAFAVAIIGGLTSGMGIILGGIILGIAETTTGFYISTGYKDVPGLVLLLVVLAVKPAGLFGKTAIKKV